jgi:hypothetical protein
MFWVRILAAVFTGFLLDTAGMQGEPERMPVWVPALLFAAGLVLPAGMKKALWQVPVAVFAGACLSHTVMLGRDLAKDPTSHNLWPFEFVILGVLNVLTFAGTGLTAAAQKVFARSVRN